MTLTRPKRAQLVAYRFAVGLTMVGSLLAGCGPNGSTRTAGQGAVSSSSAAATWPAPGEIAIGRIPADEFHAHGYAFYPAPSDASPKITQAQAVQAATSGNPIGAAQWTVRGAYLVEAVSGLPPNRSSLDWIIDLTPDQPFPPIGGGAAVAGSSPGAIAGSTPGAIPTSAYQQWLWAMVNTDTGAYGIYAG